MCSKSVAGEITSAQTSVCVKKLAKSRKQSTRLRLETIMTASFIADNEHEGNRRATLFQFIEAKKNAVLFLSVFHKVWARNALGYGSCSCSVGINNRKNVHPDTHFIFQVFSLEDGTTRCQGRRQRQIVLLMCTQHPGTLHDPGTTHSAARPDSASGLPSRGETAGPGTGRRLAHGKAHGVPGGASACATTLRVRLDTCR